jgi:hypothetical protein
MPCPAMAGAALATWFGQPATERAEMETGGRLTARRRGFPGRPASTAGANTPGPGRVPALWPGTGHHTERAGRTDRPNSASYPRCRRHAQSTVHEAAVCALLQTRIDYQAWQGASRLRGLPGICCMPRVISLQPGDTERPVPAPSRDRSGDSWCRSRRRIREIRDDEHDRARAKRSDQEAATNGRRTG